jgi:hypothetical protein
MCKNTFHKLKILIKIILIPIIIIIIIIIIIPFSKRNEFTLHHSNHLHHLYFLYDAGKYKRQNAEDKDISHSQKI